MTTRIAIWLGLAILALVAADQIWWQGRALIFAMRKLFALVEWMAFWR
ncbi:hypothetical protein [Rhodosalinus sediminis]|nr:hypothetical protein [Rhodosalinus sediminis]